MKTISILMNCFNGEKYLKEAIDSVFNQTYKNWEIIFIDNCSSDKSADIANSYGLKLKYFKTPKNIPFGEARAFGVERCNGDYLMYLDVDDRYHNNTVEILINEIINTNYLVVYSGHININENGKKIGTHETRPKSGIIFSDLLKQYDVPTASLIMDMNKYKKLGHIYDSEMEVSAEYNHFLKLSVKNQFKCIEGTVIDYRIHSNGLTLKRGASAFKDRVKTLNDIILEYPETLKTHAEEYKEAFARADYYLARKFINDNDLTAARKILRKHVFLSLNYFAVYLTLFMPNYLRTKIFKLKYKR